MRLVGGFVESILLVGSEILISPFNIPHQVCATMDFGIPLLSSFLHTHPQTPLLPLLSPKIRVPQQMQAR